MGAQPADLSVTPTGDRGVMAQGMQFSRMMQSQRERLITQVAGDPASARAILGINESLERLALTMTKSNGVLIQAMQGLQVPIEALISGIDTLGDTLDNLKSALDWFSD